MKDRQDRQLPVLKPPQPPSALTPRPKLLTTPTAPAPAHLDAAEAVEQLRCGVHAAQSPEAGVHKVTSGQLDVVGISCKA